ncbi:MAG: hypothetical protein HRT65_11180 [Flavobacteriaceae bacterium]|nr:hypothetical protein [Flavobacteriaceae bacterium]
MKWLRYLRFLLRSTNEHGIHSPFVFNYVTQGLYARKKRDSVKSIDALLKSIGHFATKRMILWEGNGVKRHLAVHYPGITFDQDPFDCCYVGVLDKARFEALHQHDGFHNDSWVFIDNLQNSVENRTLWNALITAPQFTVSIDLFHCGLLFYRREQPKQHFRIRI